MCICEHVPRNKFLASEWRDSNAIYLEFPCGASSLSPYQSCHPVLVCQGLSANSAVKLLSLSNLISLSYISSSMLQMKILNGHTLSTDSQDMPLETSLCFRRITLGAEKSVTGLRPAPRQPRPSQPHMSGLASAPTSSSSKLPPSSPALMFAL